MPFKKTVSRRKAQIDNAVDNAHRGVTNPKPVTSNIVTGKPGKASVTRVPTDPKRKPYKVF